MIVELLLSAAVAVPIALFLGHSLRWRAPARKNTPWKAFMGFFLPILLVLWSASVLMTPSGPNRWAATWLPIGLGALVAAVLMATVASPRKPTKREERRVERRGEPLDPHFLLYSFMLGILVLAAVVTRDLWV